MLYHIAFGQPHDTREIRKWNLLTDEIADLTESFDFLSLRSLKKGALADLWQKTSVLLPRNLLEAIVCEETLNAIRRHLRKKSGVLLPPEEILRGVRRLLNETAVAELEDVKISLPKKPTRKRRSRNANEAQTPDETDEEAEQETQETQGD